ncbi:carbonic anhydrase 6 [Osmerus mordax]|uniref:carbonic anhydrase 6 n=1 Tax=Osmerus mordax TaxID=8014 RepID=UPI0035105FE2
MCGQEGCEGTLEQERWAFYYPACSGQKQSPIDIQRRSVRYNPRLLQLDLSGYETQKGKFLMTNNGNSVKISLPSIMAITKGLPDRYTAVQMHLHWGGWDMEASGSEHTLDGIRYMAELHIVHYNSEKYKSFKEAIDKPDGLAILAFFYEDGNFENTYYSEFINNLSKIKYAGQAMNISYINVRSMLPENLNHYFRYQGSLTTPPCDESILWTVFDTPIILSHNQIRKLESTLMDHENKTIWNYYRMAQPLNDRVVESSFLPHLGKGTTCHQEDIESKLLKIEGLISSLGRQIESKHQALSLPVLHFPDRTTGSYVLAHLEHPMNLQSFTACMRVRTLPGGKHTVLSYSSVDNDNELMITMGFEVGLWIGNEFVNLPHSFHSQDWANYCITWSSHSGGAELWINGLEGEEQYLRGGYTISPGGVFILGKDQDGFLGITYFAGQMTDVNVWDYVLSLAEIKEQMLCGISTMRGNAFSWGVTQLSLYGGVQLHIDQRCT